MNDLLEAFLSQLHQGKLLELHIPRAIDIEQDLEEGEIEYPTEKATQTQVSQSIRQRLVMVLLGPL